MEDIAIIGMACRFPGARNLLEYEHMLRNGDCAISEVPSDRWEPELIEQTVRQQSGKTLSKYGAFLDGIDQFDASFFNISPREAVHMDPQQRLLLETSWEALENAGVVPNQLAGSRSGVYVGIMNADYNTLQNSDLNGITPFSGPGSQPAITANRLSYYYDFRGPSIAMDTACSSSLVAIHQACQALRLGEAYPIALACGVNVMLSPAGHVFFSKAGVMSADGLCRTFDAEASGFSRGEGAGVIVLKPLSLAIQDGDPIWAVIKGSAVNQDGRTNGLMAPNRFSQEEVLRDAYLNANVDAKDIHYVELHGTGTLLGDPIEANALGAVLAQGRSNGQHCLVGSVKTNIGHLESAAGIAGVIKVALMMRRREIFPSLHYERPNPYIPFEQLPIRVASSRLPWPDQPGSALAGVSAFGFGGTNVHVVIAEAPSLPGAPLETAEHHPSSLLLLSAKDRQALEAMAQAYAAAVPALASLDDLCYSSAVRRTHHSHRLAIVFHTKDEVRQQLEAFGSSSSAADLFLGTAPPMTPRIVYVFTGQGSQWQGMGRELMKTENVFRSAVIRCCDIYERLSGISLLEEFVEGAAPSRVEETRIAQPAIFALQVGLCALLESWGLKPGGVIGHSVGELAAAYVAGSLELEDALRVIFYRSTIMQRITGNGKMMSILSNWENVNELIGTTGADVCIAAVNDAKSTVVAGSALALEQLELECKTRSLSCLYLPVDYAFHSPQLSPYQEELREALRGIAPKQGTIPQWSTLSGGPITGTEHHADYWAEQMCRPVRFADAIDAASQEGSPLFVEIGPHAVLKGSIESSIRNSQKDGAVIPTLMKEKNDRLQLLRAAAQLYRYGIELHWDRLFAGGSLVPLPAYPWQRESYWYEQGSEMQAALPSSHSAIPSAKLCGQRLRLPGQLPYRIWHNTLDITRYPWLQDHQIQHSIVVPGAAFIEIVLAAMQERYEPDAVYVLKDLQIRRALFLPPAGSRSIQLHITDQAMEEYSFQTYSSDNEADPTRWEEHVTGNIALVQREAIAAPQRLVIDESVRRLWQRVSATEFYANVSLKGLQYGPAFQGISELWITEQKAMASIIMPSQLASSAEQYVAHPSVLDACGHLLLATAGQETTTDTVYMPIGIQEVRIYGRLTERVWSIAEQKDNGISDQLEGDILIADESGQVLMEMIGLKFQRLATTPQDRPSTDNAPVQLLHKLSWKADSEPAVRYELQETLNTWIVFAGEQAESIGAQVAGLIGQRPSLQTIMVTPGSSFRQRGPEHYEIRPGSVEDMTKLFDYTKRALSHGCGIVDTWPLKHSQADNLMEVLPHSMLLVQEAARRSSRGEARIQIWYATAGAQAVTEQDRNSIALGQAALWGFSRTMAVELPHLWGGIIDLAPGDLPAAAAQCLRSEIFDIRADADHAFAAYRNGSRYTPSLLPLHSIAKQPMVYTSADAYVITGGLGELGLALAEWLIKQGAVYIALIGRSPIPARQEWEQMQQHDKQYSRVLAIQHLERLGGIIFYGAADIADASAVQTMLSDMREAGLPRIRGVFHLAGYASSQLIETSDSAALERTLAPKTKGTWNLHQALLEEPIEMFVMFSSAASIVGSPFLSAYAAANAYMDAFALYRSALGFPTVSINWGPWAQIGMAARNSHESQTSLGRFALIEPEHGFRLMNDIIASHLSQVAVLPFLNRQTYAPTTRPSSEEAWSWPETGEDTSRSLLQLLLAHTAEVLNLPPHRLDTRQSMLSYGFDSLLLMELKKRVEASVHVTLPLVSLLQGPSLEQLSSIVQQQLQAAATMQEVREGLASDPEELPDQREQEEAERLLEQIDDLSEEEIERLLEGIMSEKDE